MKSISMPVGDATGFVQKISDSLASRELGKIVSLSTKGNEILVKFSKLGTSEIKYRCAPSEKGGFVATLESEKIAFAHKVFRNDIEAKLASVMSKHGATIGG